MRHLVIAGSVLLLCASATSARVTITRWDFNSQTGTTNTAFGAGSLSLLGGTTATFASGIVNGGSSDPVTTNPPNFAYNVSTWAAQGAESGQRGIRFNTSTAGYASITVTMDMRFSNSMSRYVRFEYTTDGTTFTTAGLANGGVYQATLGGDTWYNGVSFDISGVAGVNNNANFAFRVVSIFAPSTSAYQTSTTGTNYATSGTLRFDYVTISGNLIPLPTGAAMGVSGLALLACRRRRA